jgi:spore germination protein YaaH
MAWMRRTLIAATVMASVPVLSRAADHYYAFNQPEDPTSAASLAVHIGAIDGLMPSWLQVLGPGDDIHVTPDDAGRAAIAAAGPRLPVLPLVYNASAGQWFGAEIAAMLASPSRRSSLLDRLEAQITALGAKGATFDFETLPPSAQGDYVSFLAQARARFSRRGWQVAVAVASADPAWDLKAYGVAVDLVLLMDYDQHWPGGEPGPVAAAPWFEANLVRAAGLVPPDKLIAGMAAYGYDWPQAAAGEVLSAPQALVRAQRFGVTPQRDAASGSMTFTYEDQGRRHVVWFPDAQTMKDQMAAARRHGARNFAFWRLGLEDPAVWSAFGRPAR